MCLKNKQMGCCNVNVICMDINICAIITIVGGAGHNVRSFRIGGHHLGPKVWPLYGVERCLRNRGFLSTVLIAIQRDQVKWPL